MALGWSTPFARHVGYPGFASTGVVLVCDGTVFSLGGNDTNLLCNRLLPSVYGQFISNGQNSIFKYDKVIGLSSSSIAIVGQNANVLAQRMLGVVTESYAISGKDAGLFYNKILTSLNGTFLLTGNEVGFILTLSSSNQNYEVLLNIQREYNLSMNINRIESVELNISRSQNMLG